MRQRARDERFRTEQPRRGHSRRGLRESVSQAERLSRAGPLPSTSSSHGIEAAMLTLDDKCTRRAVQPPGNHAGGPCRHGGHEVPLSGRHGHGRHKGSGRRGDPRKGTSTIWARISSRSSSPAAAITSSIVARTARCESSSRRRRKNVPWPIGISGLITSIIPLVRQVKDQLLLRGLDR